MSERPTVKQLRELRNWLERKAAPPGKAMPFARVPSSDTLAFNWALALLDAYEALAHRSEQAAPPAEPEAPASIDPVLEARVFASSLNGDCCGACEQGMPCECESAAPPSDDVHREGCCGTAACPACCNALAYKPQHTADDVRARIMHELAAQWVRLKVPDGTTARAGLERYIADYVELERRARELGARIGRWRKAWHAEVLMMDVLSAYDALAELLGTEEA